MKRLSGAELTRQLSKGPLMAAAVIATSSREGWQTTALGEVAERISTGATPPSKASRYYGGEIDWFTPSDIGGVRWLEQASKAITEDAIAEKKARTFEQGTLLITCIGQIGRVGLAGRRCSANQQITGIKFRDLIDPEFAYYSLFARRDELETAASATTLPILNQTRLRDITLSYPPLEEQRQIARFLAWCEDRLLAGYPFNLDIPPLPPYLSDLPRTVARIEELAALIEEAQGLRVKAREEAESLLGSELDRMFDRSRDNDLPLGWNWLTIGELLKEGKDGIRTGPFGTLLNKSDFQSRGVPLIGIACVDANKFHPSRCDYIFEEKAEELARYGVVNGDVIVARSGTVGRCCVVENLDLGIMSSNLMRLRFNMDKCNPRLVCQLLNGSALIQRQIDEKCRGTTRTFFNQKILTSMEAPLPGINEQHRIVAYLDSLQAQVDELTALQDATQAELDALLPSVLDRAFRGELRASELTGRNW